MRLNTWESILAQLKKVRDSETGTTRFPIDGIAYQSALTGAGR